MDVLEKTGRDVRVVLFGGGMKLREDFLRERLGAVDDVVNARRVRSREAVCVQLKNIDGRTLGFGRFGRYLGELKDMPGAGVSVVVYGCKIEPTYP